MTSLFFFYSLLCCFFLSQSFSSSSVHHLCSSSEASALLQFKKPFGISLENSAWCDTSSFPKTTSWNESRDCCSWDGVKCDMLTGHVIGLDLSCSKLSGTIHPNSSLFQIHLLRSLNLAYNNFSSSSIPSGIGRLRNLRHLNLSDSVFSGKIPTEISDLSNLVSLDLSSLDYCELDQKTFETLLQNFTNLKVVSLSSVDISSPIPMNVSSSLRYVNLEVTNLQGVLTESFFLLQNLERLNLGYNFFTGQIPNSIGNLTQIRELYLGSNHFTGQIPNFIGKLTQIRELNLCDNHFTGQIPNSIGNLTQIRELHLGSNHFTGQIPSTISNLKQLTYLDLSYNSLGGEIPNVFSNLQELEQLDLSGNSLNGTIPSWVFSLPSLNTLSLHHNQFSRVADELKANPTLKILYLSHNQLSGPFLQSLENLTNLSFLDLSSNNMDARINITFPSLAYLFLSSCEPKAFPHLRNSTTLVFLDLSNNKLDGPIPNWFSGMRWDSLEYLNLSHSSLTGHIEQLHYPNLKYLDLKFNSLQGQLPSSICKLKSLQLLDLSHNHFSDSVPHCLGSMAELSVLDLRRNNFAGSLPPLCAQSASLRTIVLNCNQFEGPAPVSLVNCTGLKVLDMGNNAINDTFPSWLGTLEQLQVLILRSNKFNGPISTRKKFCFPRLRIFDLSHNEFSGSLPAEVFRNFKAMIKLDDGGMSEMYYMQEFVYTPYGRETLAYDDSMRLVIKGQDTDLPKINSIMTAIDLSSNHFEGVIPKTLKDLASLRLLNLSHNNLKGDIPMELGQLNMLESLDISWNRLTGKIPQELTRLTFLAKLNLSQNNLVGPIPHGPQFNTFENDSYGGNLDLCGFPLSKQCGTSDPSHVPPPLESEEEDESYFLSGFTWESVVIGYSCGLVVGAVMWSLMFKARKPKWLVEFLEGVFPKKMRRAKKRNHKRRT